MAEQKAAAGPTGIWVCLENADGALLPASLEILGRARELADTLGDRLTAVVLGDAGAEGLAREAVLHGADAAIAGVHPLLVSYGTDGHTKAMDRLVRERRPNILLFASTPNGRDLAGRLAVRLHTGLTANAVKLEVNQEKRLLLAGVPGFGGSIVAMIKCETGRPQMSTVRGGVFKALPRDPARKGPVEVVRIALSESDVQCRLVERRKLEREDVSGALLSVVAGLGTAGDMDRVQAIAESAGAVVGVTRPLVDMGLAAREKQVGSTGIALRSKLSLVLGVSGSSHFTSGLKDVGTVIAVNQDPQAEIFDHADVCVVGDLNELMPAVLEELQRVKRVQEAREAMEEEA